MSDELKSFLEKAEEIKFFGKVGGELESSIPRIRDWKEWPDPEGNSVAPIHYRQQALHDKLVEQDEEVLEYWNTLVNFVLDRAKPNIPWIEGEDSWYAPNTAAWHAGWTFALYAFCIINEFDPPVELKTQWAWFSKGHWPCAVNEYNGDEPVSFVIY
jgi:hypothetical protein